VPYLASAAQKQWGGQYSTLAGALGKMVDYYKYGGGQQEAANRLAFLRGGTSAGTNTDSGNGGDQGQGKGQRIDRIVNVYISPSARAYPVPTNASGQSNIESMAREVVRQLEDARGALGS
jgi:hypothetical protein